MSFTNWVPSSEGCKFQIISRKVAEWNLFYIEVKFSRWTHLYVWLKWVFILAVGRLLIFMYYFGSFDSIQLNQFESTDWPHSKQVVYCLAFCRVLVALLWRKPAKLWFWEYTMNPWLLDSVTWLLRGWGITWLNRACRVASGFWSFVFGMRFLHQSWIGSVELLLKVTFVWAETVIFLVV